MSFYHLPHPYDPRYAIPRYVMAEPPERGTFTTRQLPRGTIPSLVPDYLAAPGKRILGRSDADLGSLAGHCLQGDTLTGHTLQGHSLSGDVLRSGDATFDLQPLGADDSTRVLQTHGQRLARGLVSRMRALPESQRVPAMRALLNHIDKNLWASVDGLARSYRNSGLSAKESLERALGERMTVGLVREIVALGARAQRGDKSAPQSGQLGLAAYDALDQLGGWWGTVKGYAGDVGDAVADGAKWVAKNTCGIVTNQYGQVAIGAAAVGLGAGTIVAGAGVQLAAAACSKAYADAPGPGALTSADATTAAAAAAAAAAAPAKTGMIFQPRVTKAGTRAQSKAGRFLLPAAIAGGALLLLGAG